MAPVQETRCAHVRDFGQLKGPITVEDLEFVDALLRSRAPRLAGVAEVFSEEYMSPITPTDGVVPPPSTPTVISIYDRDGRTNAGLDGLDDDVMALRALQPEKSRETFEIADWPGRGSSRTVATRVMGAMMAGFGGREPMTHNTLFNRQLGRRPQQRSLSVDPQPLIDEWFEKSGIDAGLKCESEEQLKMARRLAYTWKDCFAFSLQDVRVTDLVEHSIELEQGAKPFRLRQPRYTPDEVAFASRLLPRMEAAEFCGPGVSEWAAHTRYPPKKNGSRRFVCNYIPVNSWTRKPQWPTHSRDKAFDTLLQADHDVWYQGDAANGYFGVKVKEGHEYKTAFITPNMQYFMYRMPQGMTGSGHTYCALGDLAFGEWPVPPDSSGTVADGPALPGLIGHHPQWRAAFDVYVDDHNASARGYDAMFAFLHNHYFPRVDFARITLEPRKTVLFGDRILSIGFELLQGQMRPAEKHRKRFEQWARPENHPKSAKELDEFLFLLPYLKQFVPGRAARVLVLKTSSAELVHKTTPSGQKSKQKMWLDKPFKWEQRHADAFTYICQQIQERIVTAPDRQAPYHLATDASDVALGGVLFQIADQPFDVEMTDKMMPFMRILAFLSFKLEDAETRYLVGERETLAMMRCLRDVRPWVIESRYPTVIYTDHLNLIATLTAPDVPTGRVAHWIDELHMYDVRIVHRPNTTQVIGIADGMSRITGPMAQPPEYTPSFLPTFRAPAQLGRPMVRDSRTGTLLPYAALHRRRLRNPGITTDAPYMSGSGWYAGIFMFLLGGDEYVRDIPHQRRRQIKRDALRYKLMDGTLYRMDDGGDDYAVCVMETEVRGALQWAHDHHGHFGVASTIQRLRGNLWWPTRYLDVEEYVASCRACAAISVRRPIHRDPIPVVSLRPWDLVGMDYTGQVNPPGYDGSTHIHVICDYFSRFAMVRATKEPTSDVVCDTWGPIVSVLGFPEEVVMDNARYFTSKKTVDFFEKGGTRVRHPPVSSPRSVGLIERVVRLVKDMLKKWAHGRGYQNLDHWPDYLRDIMGAINSRIVRGMAHSPNDVMFGWPMRATTNEDHPLLSTPDREQLATLMAASQMNQDDLVQPFIDRREWLRYGEREHWIERAVDAKPNEVLPFRVGDWVWENVPKTRDIKVKRFDPQQYPEDRDNTRANMFKPRWTGPWRVCGIASSLSVWICDPVTGRRRRKVHVINLKTYHRRREQTGVPPPGTPVEQDEREETIADGHPLEESDHIEPVQPPIDLCTQI